IFHQKGKEYFTNYLKDVFHVTTPLDVFFTNQVTKQCHRMQLLLRIQRALYLSLLGDAIPINLQQKISHVLDFYSNYRHMIKNSAHQSIINITRRLDNQRHEECDIIIGIKLTFWPKITEKFLKRLKIKRFHLYDVVKYEHVYIIPKW
ncbi:unnamed protein product, partial [Didymodactylos carnosus]